MIEYLYPALLAASTRTAKSPQMVVYSPDRLTFYLETFSGERFHGTVTGAETEGDAGKIAVDFPPQSAPGLQIGEGVSLFFPGLDPDIAFHTPGQTVTRIEDIHPQELHFYDDLIDPTDEGSLGLCGDEVVLFGGPVGDILLRRCAGACPGKSSARQRLGRLVEEPTQRRGEDDIGYTVVGAGEPQLAGWRTLTLIDRGYAQCDSA